MVTIVDVSVPASEVELGRAFRDAPDVEIELERLVPTGGDVAPLVWVTTDGREAAERVLDDVPMVEEATFLTTDGSRYLYEVVWDGRITSVIDLLAEAETVLLDGRKVGRQWNFRLQFRNRDSLTVFRERAEERGIPIVLRRLYRSSYPIEGDALTAAQREALLVAFSQGYFDVPRRVTTSELADQLDISDNAFSQRLRRGTSALIADTLTEL